MDETSCDPLYRKAIRVSVGAALKVPFVRQGSAEAMVEALVSQGYQVLALSPSGVAELGEAPRPARTALLLGTEGEGLPKPLMDRLDTVRIGMRDDFDSLNVATAGAIALHHFRRV